jgi:type I restriction enzyme S subunit
MSFARYPSYKDSGVEWLGEVPGHWEVISIKWLSPVRRGASPRPIDDPKYFDEDGEFAWVRIADVSACNGVLTETTQQLSELGSSLSVKMAPGELFVSIAGTVGKPCLSAINACIHDGFVYFPTLKVDPKFLYRIFEGGTCYGGLGKWGTQLNLNTDTIGSIRIALPPKDELQQVLAFLDRETAKIDGLVAEQRRLMGLLKEKRQAVISHAVTQGLNPDAPMKPSGIEWLGDVPEHWEVRPLKRLARLQTGMTPPTDDWDNYNEDEGFQWVRPEDLDETGTPTKSSKFLTDKGWLLTRKIKAGASLICCIGTIGKVGITTDVVSTNQQITAAEPQQDGRYLFYTICAGRSELELASTGNVLRILNTERLGNIRCTNPPLLEQTQIAAYLDSQLTKFDTLTLEAQRAIDLLAERRTALISAAVTGQIDVRGAF